MVARSNLEVRGLFAAVISGTNRATCQLTLPDGSSRTFLYPAGKLLGSALRPGMRIARRIGPRTWASGEGQSQIVLKDELDCLLAGPLGLCPVCQREPLRSPLLLGYTISHYRSAQRCAAIFPVGGMKHSQDDPRRSLRPPDGGRDDLLGEVMRKKRFVPTQRVASRSGGSVLRIGIRNGLCEIAAFDFGGDYHIHSQTPQGIRPPTHKPQQRSRRTAWILPKRNGARDPHLTAYPTLMIVSATPIAAPSKTFAARSVPRHRGELGLRTTLRSERSSVYLGAKSGPRQVVPYRLQAAGSPPYGGRTLRRFKLK